MRRNGNGRELVYSAVNRSDVPQGRKGKHRKAVSDILGDLSKLKTEEAVKIPLSSLNGEKMQNLRSGAPTPPRTSEQPSSTLRRAARSRQDKVAPVGRCQSSHLS